MRICWSGFSKTNKGSESVLTTILTIYRSGLRGNYGLCGTKKHGFRTKKHEKARKMRQKTDAFAFGTSMPQVRILSLRPNLTNSNVRNSKRTVNGLVRFFLYFRRKSSRFFSLSLCPVQHRSRRCKRKKISPKNENRYRTARQRYLVFSISKSNIFLCTESSHDLSLTSAHLTRNEHDQLPTYAPLTLPKGKIKNQEVIQNEKSSLQCYPVSKR